ncbi:MAG TPA: MazG family protein, partial [Lachnospiraceae bacterium]|nr:MazG family protein [Lachnospiraceae bacterium]
MEQNYSFNEFCEIIERLRAKDGCPWDREQTHASLRPCMTEEAAELVSSIRIYEETNDPENMIEELGDVLLQVVMHAEIAKEEQVFDINDVITTVSEKMIRRHPHVFGDVKADTTEKVLNNWEDIKKKEKEGKDWIENPLREIPLELPALRRAEKVQKKIDRQYEHQKEMA